MNLIDYIREHSAKLEVKPTDTEARLQRLDIEVVLFDIYGTLMISASGDIGVAQSVCKTEALSQALDETYGYTNTDLSQQLLIDAIKADHERTRRLGYPFPEVDIVEIWQGIAARLKLDTRSELARQAAVIYECATNPVWPMPGLEACLLHLQGRGLDMGIISNAQFYTPLLFSALSPQGLYNHFINSELCWFSYQSKRAKPDVWMYEQAKSALAQRGIAAERVLYVGNDMLNDMLPASQVGFKTALFAGDARSLRLRHDHPHASQVTVDCVMTHLEQIKDICS